jgi:CheY-like chemotaxis protein
MAKTLLVVDQNIAVHRLLDFTLSKEGFEIVAVEDGLSALDRAYQHAPDLIMVNSQLDGLPLSMFVRKLREQEALHAVPIILMAQSSDNLNLEQLKRSGITDVVKKPLDAMEINATINRCVGPFPAAPVAVAAEKSANAAGTSSNPSQNGSTEEDQSMMQMEQLLGWVPRNKTGPPAQPSEPPAPAPAASTPPAPPVPESQPMEKPFEFEVFDPTADPAASAPQNDLASTPMDDLLMTGSEALFYQPPVADPPPPPEPEAAQESELPAELQELMPAQAPASVNATEPAASPPAVQSHELQSTPSSAGGLEEMTRDETERLVQSMVEEMTRKVTQETIERITKELVPELTERAVRAEIERLKAE